MATEFRYFPDPHTDRLVSLVWQLAAELHTTRQRLAAVEALLGRADILPAGTVDAFTPDAGEATEMAARRDGFLDRIMRVVTEAGPAEHPMRDQWYAQLAGQDRGDGR